MGMKARGIKAFIIDGSVRDVTARTLGTETVYAYLTPPRIPRGDLAHRRSQIAADLTAILRRQVKA